MHVYPDPKPRKRLKNEPYIDFLKTMPCIYQIDKLCREANQPHHDRTGYGDGKGAGSTRPDDYRAIRTCHVCHDSLHSTIGARYQEMTRKISRSMIYSIRRKWIRSIPGLPKNMISLLLFFPFGRNCCVQFCPISKARKS